MTTLTSSYVPGWPRAASPFRPRGVRHRSLYSSATWRRRAYYLHLGRSTAVGADAGAARENGDGDGDGDGDDDVDIIFVLRGPEGAEEDDVTEVRCVASPGDNILAAAMRCGAVTDDASAHFCLEGRCDSCIMEDVELGDEPVRTCQEPVPDDGRRHMRLWVGGGGDEISRSYGLFGDDDFWLDDEHEEEEEEEEEVTGAKEEVGCNTVDVDKVEKEENL